MPKCCMDECDSATPKVRGVAASEGWTTVDLHGPQGNKYLNICPDHDPEDALEKLQQMFSSVTGTPHDK